MKIFFRYLFMVIIYFVFVAVGYAADDPLTPEERAWLSKHDGSIILGAEPGWPPISFFDENEYYKGISAEYVSLIERRLGFRFKIEKMASFQDILDKARLNQIDVIMEIMSTPERTQYLSFTKPYIKIPTVIITRSNFSGAATLAGMAGKKVSVPGGFSVNDYLKINYPGLQLVYVPEPAEGLRRLSIGEYDAMILELPAASYIAEKEGLTNLRVAGFTGHEYSLGIGSRKDIPILNRILDKGLAMISQAERESIYRKWVHLEYQPFYRNKKFIIVAVTILGIVVFFISVILLWSRTLKHQVRARTQDLMNELNRRQQAETRLRTLVQTIPDLVWLKDENGVYLFCNRMFERFFGAGETDIIGKTDYDFLDRELADFFREHDRKAMAAGKPSVNEEWLTFADDGYRGLFDTIKTPMYDPGGKIIGVLGISRDISERERAEKELRDSEASYRNLIENIQEVVYRSDAQGNLIMANPNLLKLLGYESLDECIGKPIAETFYYNPEKRAEFLTQVQEEGSITDYEIVLKRKDGMPVTVETRTHLYFDSSGLVAGVEGIFRDITERKRVEAALVSSESQMKAIVNGSPIPQFVIDREHRIILWNRALEEYSGIRTAEVIGTNQHWRAFYEHKRPCMADLLVDGAIEQLREWYPDGYSRSGLIEDAFEATAFVSSMKCGTWLYFTAAPVRDAEGKLIGAVETLVDITVQKRAEEKLRHNAERLDALLKINQMGDSPVPEIVEYAFEEAVRLTHSEIGYLGFMNDDESVMNVQVWSRNVLPECNISGKTLHFSLKDAGLWGEAVRQRRPVVTNDYSAYSPLKKGLPEGHVELKRHMSIPVMSGSKIVLVAGVGNKSDEYSITDVQQLTLLMEGLWRIIERKRTEQELRESQRRLADIIAFLPDATLVVDRDGRVIAWNRAIEDMTGVMAEEMLGKGNYEYAIPFYGERRPILIDLVLHPEPEVEKKYTTVQKEGDILLGEALTPNLPGGSAYLSATASAFRDSGGEIIAAIECIRDKTKQKMEEDERKKLEDQLIQAQKMEAVGRLAGGVAHDFNNMLTPIMGYAELLKMNMPENDPNRAKVSEIMRASERSRDLVRQLLAFARKQTLEMKPVDLNTVISGFENMLRRTLHENIDLQIRLATPLASIMADIGQIEQIILNLGVNAQDAMPEGGTLFIVTSEAELDDVYALGHGEVKSGFYIAMEITDTGEGIDLETRKRIFEPFFTTKGGMGTGLGLATVYGIVKQHGGHISVYSEPGRGTTFRVYFPRCEGSAEVTGTAYEPDKPLQGDETLFVVEDQEQVRTMIVDGLREYGYNLIEAGDIKSALKTAVSYHGEIHLLITDVVLPDGNGRELYDSLTAEKICPKILYMSGYPSNVISHHGVLEPGVQFIQKPFSLTGFIRKVREVLDG